MANLWNTDILPLILLFENPTSSVNLDKEFAYSTRNQFNKNIEHFTVLQDDFKLLTVNSWTVML